MAGKGGGSWKVAYADFVTAMMAFFLVMWIGAQDVKVRQSVANYFVDPAGVNKRPATAGSVMSETVSGPVPKEASTDSSGGSKTPSHGEPSPSTASVMAWIREKPERLQYWKQQAQLCRQEVAAAGQAVNQTETPEKLVHQRLVILLRTAFDGDVPKDTPDVYKRLLRESFKEVNWDQVAGDILAA